MGKTKDLSTWLAQFATGDVAIRDRAFAALPGRRPTGICQLVKVLRSGTLQLRRLSAAILVKLACQRPDTAAWFIAPLTTALVNLLDDRDVSVRQAAREALLNLGALSVPTLIGRLHDGADGRVIWILEAIGPPAKRAIPVLIELLHRESSIDYGCSWAHDAATTALAAFGGASVWPMSKLLKKGNPCERMAAAQVLKTIGPRALNASHELICALEDENNDVARHAGEALSAIGRPVVPYLEKKYAREESYLKRRAILHTLCNMRTGAEDALPTILAALESTSWKESAEAAQALSLLGVAVVPFVIERLQLHDREAVAQALQVCEGLGSQAAKAVPELCRLIQGGDANLRHRAIEVIAHIGPAAGSATLVLVAVFKEFHDCRRAAIDALSSIGRAAEAAVPALIEAARALDCEEAGAAALALGNIKSAAAVPVVVQLLQRHCGRCQEAALNSIAMFGPAAKSAVFHLKEMIRTSSAHLQVQAAATLLCVDPTEADSMPVLIGALRSDSRKVRHATIEALINIGPLARATLPTICEIAADGEPESWVLGVIALEKIGGLSHAAALNVMGAATADPWTRSGSLFQAAMSVEQRAAVCSPTGRS